MKMLNLSLVAWNRQYLSILKSHPFTDISKIVRTALIMEIEIAELEIVEII